MRLNQFLAYHTALSRRAADKAITEGRVEINNLQARLGDTVIDSDKVTLDGQPLSLKPKLVTIAFNKPVDHVVSKKGQGSKTIYDVIPTEYHHLNPIGRLDKNSSGLLLLTNDGELANLLTHPKHKKEKIYHVELDKPLDVHDQDTIHDKGVSLKDGVSKLHLTALGDGALLWQVKMSEGRNRQIRRTFSSLGYDVTKLHRVKFGEHIIGDLKSGEISVIIDNSERRR